jgi:predicted nucleic acid-binding protein
MAGFLLDTNVVSELVKAAPERRVLAWVAAQAAGNLFLSAVTMGELVRGAARLAGGRRRDRLVRWIEEDLRTQFEGRILPFDLDAAVIWGHLMGAADRRGRALASADAQIAATAIFCGLAVVTRNVADFRATGVAIVDPWTLEP